MHALLEIRSDQDEDVDERLDDVPDVAPVQQLLNLVPVKVLAKPGKTKYIILVLVFCMQIQTREYLRVFSVA